MNDNPMTDAFDAAEDEQDETNEGDTADDFDVGRYLDALNSDSAPKDKTVGIAVTEEMHAFYRELRDADDVEANPTQSVRDHLEKLAHRHPEIFERSMRKLEIEREF